MDTLPNLSEFQSAACPSCGAQIKTTLSIKARRVQCPKCREVVTLQPAQAAQPVETPPASAIIPATSDDAARLLQRIETLESRLFMLEKTIAEAVRDTDPASKLRWLPKEQPADFSPAQEEALRHNLCIMPAHRITIQIPSGDQPARTRAEWFKGVFERAQWAVSGPLDATAISLPGTISIATTLPVSRETAGTYLALRAAGFLPSAIFDPTLEGGERLIVA